MSDPTVTETVDQAQEFEQNRADAVMDGLASVWFYCVCGRSVNAESAGTSQEWFDSRRAIPLTMLSTKCECGAVWCLYHGEDEWTLSWPGQKLS